MPRNETMDTFGAVSLIFFAALLGFNQVVIKVVNEGLQPVFFAGLRSAGGMVLLMAWMRYRGLSFRGTPGTTKSFMTRHQKASLQAIASVCHTASSSTLWSAKRSRERRAFARTATKWEPGLAPRPR